jgi:hypothetical protein
MNKINSVRSGLGFFLTTLAGAVLGAIGGRLAGVFGPPEAMGADTKVFGAYLLVAFIVLVVGMALRRLNGVEIRSALLGAASVLISIPLSRIAISGGSFEEKGVGLTGLGIMFVVAGLLASFFFADVKSSPHDD